MIFLSLFIFVKEGKEDVFHQFEELAIPLLHDYSGKLIYRIRPTQESFIHVHEEELPYEIHFISFESDEQFTQFAKDERRKAFLHLKEDSIRTSFMIKGQKM